MTQTATASVPPLRALRRNAAVLAADIKLSHTVFALPFAVLGMALAAGWAGRWPRAIELLLILVCMFTARTFAMTVNRLADAELDAANPRTAGRAIPAGRLGRAAAGWAIFVAATLFVLATAGFWWAAGNAWPLALALPVLGLLAGYSYTKRFTWLCHVYLGLALAVSPVAAALAIEPGYLAASPVIWLLSAMVLGWVAGFDVIYALQDTAVDRELGLHSMPSRLGPESALWISRALHLGCLGALFAAAFLSPRLGGLFLMACVATAALLVLEHTLVWRSETQRIHLAFFTVNGVISLLLGLAGLLDLLRVM
jgi:4-hydroxybenzoate polyprenyltransferase